MKVENKSDGDLKRHQSLFEKLALSSGIAVVAGLVLEVWLAVEFRPNEETAVQTWGPVVADVSVAVGVFFEILFGRWALHQGSALQQRAERALAEATERAGEAVERAAAAELETERLRKELAWRRVSPEQAHKISEVISRSDLPKFGLRIEHSANDPESITFANDIAEVFRKNGWPVLFMSTVSSFSFSGMMIPLYGPEELDACGITRIR